MRTFRKVILYLFGTLLVIAIALIASVFFFKDRIIEEFIKEANKSLSTPIKIGKIEISAWNDFPNLAIEFRDVYVEDSHPEEHALLTAKTISFFLNPIEAWNGNYSIRGLQVTDSETDLKINAVGKSNYTIVKETKEGGGSISFDLPKNQPINKPFVVSSKTGTGKVQFSDVGIGYYYKSDFERTAVGIEKLNSIAS